MKVSDLYIALCLIAAVGAAGWALHEKYSRDKAEVREVREITRELARELEKMGVRQYESLSAVRHALTSLQGSNGGTVSGIESATVAATS